MTKINIPTVRIKLNRGEDIALDVSAMKEAAVTAATRLPKPSLPKVKLPRRRTVNEFREHLRRAMAGE